MKNALAFVPRAEMQAEVVADLRAVFDAPDRPEAERQLGAAVKKYRVSAPKLADWLEANVPRVWPSSHCPGRTGGGCGRRTCWSGLTRS